MRGAFESSPERADERIEAVNEAGVFSTRLGEASHGTNTWDLHTWDPLLPGNASTDGTDQDPAPFGAAQTHCPSLKPPERSCPGHWQCKGHSGPLSL